MRYAFVAEHRPVFPVRAMCRCLRIHPSGFYTWLRNPLSKRAREDARQTELIRKAWKESGKVYGYRKLHDDLLDQGETCCPNRVARLARQADIKAQIGYRRRPGVYGGKPSVVVDNTLDRQFDVEDPDKVWVTDSLFNLTAWILLANLCRAIEVDIWRYRGVDGESICSMIGFTATQLFNSSEPEEPGSDWQGWLSALLLLVPDVAADRSLLQGRPIDPEAARMDDPDRGLPPQWWLFLLNDDQAASRTERASTRDRFSV